MEAALGLGSNIGDRVAHMKAALDAIRLLPRTNIKEISSVYETAPLGFTEQADFLNLAVLVETGLSARALLGACLGIEAAMGRERPFPNAPRVMDIDLLLYENIEMQTEELTLPHPRFAQRAFVLYPLQEIIQKSHLKNFSDFSLDSVKNQKIRKLDISIS